jgi:hypothetical protein
MDETYRMLGREREADLERAASKWHRAAAMGGSRSDRADAPSGERKSDSTPLAGVWILASLARAVRAVAFVAR